MLEFLANNYIWFFVVAGLLVLALIGFIVESKRKVKKGLKGNETLKEQKTELKQEEIVVNDIPRNEEAIETENTKLNDISYPTMQDVPEEVGTAPTFDLNNYDDETLIDNSEDIIGERITTEPIIPTATESFEVEEKKRDIEVNSLEEAESKND